MSTTRRATAIAWAVAVIADPKTVFLDTETTGLNGTAEIVDIAIVGVDGRPLLDTLVKPVRPIPSAATRVHGISDGDVKNAPRWTDVYGEVRNLLAGRRVIIYNAEYDTKILQQVTAAANLPALPIRAECAMLQFASYEGTIGRYGDPKWHKLDAAAQHFGFSPGGHRALGDPNTTRRVVIAMAKAAPSSALRVTPMAQTRTAPPSVSTSKTIPPVPPKQVVTTSPPCRQADTQPAAGTSQVRPPDLNAVSQSSPTPKADSPNLLADILAVAFIIAVLAGFIYLALATRGEPSAACREDPSLCELDDSTNQYGI